MGWISRMTPTSVRLPGEKGRKGRTHTIPTAQMTLFLFLLLRRSRVRARARATTSRLLLRHLGRFLGVFDCCPERLGGRNSWSCCWGVVWGGRNFLRSHRRFGGCLKIRLVSAKTNRQTTEDADRWWRDASSMKALQMPADATQLVAAG